VSGMGDLYPGGPAQPINFSVTNPGSIPDALATVTIAVAADPVSNLVEAVPGYTSSDIAGCTRMVHDHPAIGDKRVSCRWPDVGRQPVRRLDHDAV